MKLAFTGCHGTGKTTLINKILELDLLPDYEFSTNITRTLKEQGFSISDAGDDQTQFAVMHKHQDNLMFDDVIMDRCALDCLVYTAYLYLHNKVNVVTYNIIFDNAVKCINQYSKIFYLEPEFEIEDDGVRPVDKVFQHEITSLFHQYIDTLRLRVIPLTGTVEQRIETFKQNLGA